MAVSPPPEPPVAPLGWLRSASDVAWRLLVVLAAIVALLVVLSRLQLVAVPIFIALLIAAALAPPTRYLERRAVPTDAVGQIRGQEQQDRRGGNLGPMSLLCDGTIEVPHLGWYGEREKHQKRNGPGHAEHPHRLEELLFQGLL